MGQKNATCKKDWSRPRNDEIMGKNWHLTYEDIKEDITLDLLLKQKYCYLKPCKNTRKIWMNITIIPAISSVVTFYADFVLTCVHVLMCIQLHTCTGLSCMTILIPFWLMFLHLSYLFVCVTEYCQLRTRRALSLFNNSQVHHTLAET